MMFEGKRNSDGFPEWTESEFRKAYENEIPKPDEKEMLYIVAGTMKEASLFARAHHIYPPDWRMVSDKSQLLGATGNVVYVGSYYNRRDLQEIKEYVSIGIETGLLKVVELDE